jgi:hypothetical protein
VPYVCKLADFQPEKKHLQQISLYLLGKENRLKTPKIKGNG